MNTQLINTIAVQQHIAVCIFPSDELKKIGFQFMGNCWGNSNLPYHEIETQLGSLCIVANNEVYLIRGRKEDRLDKIKSLADLNNFTSYLS